MKRIVFSLMLAPILISTLAIAVYIKPVKAEWTGTVYIRADGSVYPSGAPIQTSDNVTYTLTDNITSFGPGIIVERDNIIIEGAGYTLQGTLTQIGIDLTGRNNVTIKDLEIKGFYYGVFLNFSSTIILYGNIITTNMEGILLYNSSNNSITANGITKNYFDGIWLISSLNNSITRNNIASNNLGGIVLSESSNNSIIGNIFRDNGLTVVDSYKNIVMDNFVNDKPLVYLEDVSDSVVENAGQVILVNCNNVLVGNLSLSHTDAGIQLLRTNNTSIIGNNIANNSWWGVVLRESLNNSVIGNNIANNNIMGILLYSSSNNSIIGNNITANNLGIRLRSSLNNNIHHNNLINNTNQTSTYNSYNNNWDDGYSSGGNYWSNYISVDFYSGPNQNRSGSDGIGDTPYVIDEDNADRYPLMAPFNTFDAGVWNGKSYNVDVISNSSVSGFQFDVNQKSVRFNVTGDDGTVGFCRVTIPKELLWVEDGWTITVDDQSITNYLESEDEKFTYLYFSYHHSTQTVTIQGTHVIPEYSPSLILPPFMIFSMLTIVFAKKQFRRKRPTFLKFDFNSKTVSGLAQSLL